MEYIKKSDVLAVMQSEIERLNGSSTLDDIVWKFDRLPTIDPINILEEMIDYRCNNKSTENEDEVGTLEYALSRIRNQY